MAANRTVITNPFYADGDGEKLSAALSPAAEAESGDDGAEDVAPSEEPMSPGKRSLWDDPAQDKKEPEHPPFIGGVVIDETEPLAAPTHWSEVPLGLTI